MTEITPCLREPCMNEGICTEPSKDTYDCQCPDGITGDVCESGESITRI